MTDQAYNPADYGGSGDAPPVNPFLPSKLQALGMMLGGLGSGISQAAARNQSPLMGIAPGVQNFNNSYYGALGQGLKYDLALKNYGLQRDYKQMQERMLGLQARQLETNQRLQQYGINALAKMGLIPGEDGATPGIRAPQPPLLGPGSTPAPSTDLKQTGGPMVDYMSKTYGLTQPQAAGVVGNLYQESGFNPTASHDGGTGFGMAGWDPQRTAGLVSFAKSKGAQPSDPQTQLDYIAYEGQNGDMGAQRAWQMLKGAQTPQDATTAMMHFFRPQGYTPSNPQDGNGYAQRVQYAQTLTNPSTPPQAAPQQGPSGLPPIPQPPANIPQLSAIGSIPGLQMFGGIAKGQQADFENKLKYSGAQLDLQKYRQSQANQPVGIGPDGRAVIQQAPIQAKAAEAAAVEEAKRQGHLNSILPEGWEGMQPDDLRAKMNPLIVKSADQLASFDKPLSQLPARLGGGNGITKDELLSVTQLLHPDWTPLKAENREKFVAYMQPDKQGGQTTAAIGNAAQHLTEAAEAFNEMNNGKLPIGNRLFNALKTQNGWGNQVAFDTVKEAIGTEVAKAIAGSADTGISEREAHRELMDAASSPEQMQKVLARYAGLFGKRINTINSQAKAVGLGPDWVNARIGEEGVKALGALPGAIRQTAGGAPDSAISYLKANPSLAVAFDQKYGAGSAAKVLGK